MAELTTTKAQAKAELKYRSVPKASRKARKDFSSPAIALTKAELEILAGVEVDTETAPKSKRSPKRAKTGYKLSELAKAQRSAKFRANQIMNKYEDVEVAIKVYAKSMKNAKAV